MSIRDLASPELIKKAEEFTEAIKSGAIRNPHRTIYKPVLHLNLKSVWFDMIFSRIKKEEYREIKPYWERYLVKELNLIRIKNQLWHPSAVIICFSNGYSKDRRQFYIECKDLVIGEGKPEWGAEKGKRYFVLKLGDVIEC